MVDSLWRSDTHGTVLRTWDDDRIDPPRPYFCNRRQSTPDLAGATSATPARRFDLVLAKVLQALMLSMIISKINYGIK